MTLYEDIGIPTAASPREIHLAYRKAAKRHHPDAGGDPDTFAKIAFAYEVLSDPDRRHKYDQTGSADPSTPDNSIGQLINTLGALFSAAMGSALKHNLHPETIDMVGLMIAEADEATIKAIDANKNANTNLETLTPLLDRFETIDPAAPNHLETMLRGQVSGIQRVIDQNTKSMAQIAAAKTYLAGCRYRKKSPLILSAFQSFA